VKFEEETMRSTVSIVLAASLAVLSAGTLSAAADKALTATGTIRTVQASSRTLVVALADGGEARFTWNDETKITGVLAPGAKVTIRYVPGDGGHVALQITVPRS
jgi:ABC-type amino acid transport substrate-binding protein